MSGTVKTYVDPDNTLRPLIRMLNEFSSQGSPFPIPEIMYHGQMSQTGTLPRENFYPYAIITYLMERHEQFLYNIWSGARFEAKFQCQYYENGYLRVHEFSNKMLFYADVITLIYLYVYYKVRGTSSPAISELLTMMVNKYQIHEDVSYREIYEANPKKITFRRVTESFQSIQLWMYSYVPTFTTYIRNVFPYGSLPPMIGSPFFPLILFRQTGQRSCHKYLITLNMAVGAFYRRASMTWISDYINECLTSFSVYTPDIRMDICKKLGILINRNGIYSFAPNFEEHPVYYAIARNRISYATQKTRQNGFEWNLVISD